MKEKDTDPFVNHVILYDEALTDLYNANVSGGELEMLAAYLAKLREE